jgi:outer membrane protein TolC
MQGIFDRVETMKRLLIVMIMLAGAQWCGAGRALCAGDELTLDRAMDAALSNHPTVAQLKATVEQSRRQLGQSRSALYPTLDYQLSTSTTVGDESAPSSTAASATSAALASMFAQDEGDVSNALSLNYTLYDAGRRPGIRAGREFLTAAELDLARFRDQLAVNVFTAFMSAYMAGQALHVQEQSRDYFSELRREARVRFEEGLIAESDFLTFADAYDQADIAVLNNSLQMRKAVIGLENLMHEPLGEDVRLALPGAAEPMAAACDVEALVAQALEQREDVQSARARAAALGHTVNQVKGALKPSITVGAAYQISENDIGDVDSYDDLTRITAQMNWRLTDGGRRRNAVLEAGARREQVLAQLNSLEWGVRREVRDACYAIDNAQSRIGILESSVGNAEKNLEIVTLRYKEGLITVSYVTDAELNLTRARLSMIQARVDLALGRRAMNLAIGGVTQ